jgi:hypothetical protein
MQGNQPWDQGAMQLYIKPLIKLLSLFHPHLRQGMLISNLARFDKGLALMIHYKVSTETVLKIMRQLQHHPGAINFPNDGPDPIPVQYAALLHAAHTTVSLALLPYFTNPGVSGPREYQAEYVAVVDIYLSSRLGGRSL